MDDIKEFLQSVCYLQNKEKVSLYLVGGVIRDFLISNTFLTTKEIDFLVVGDARKFANVFKEEFGGEIKIFDAFYTSKILGCPRFSIVNEIDFASAREEMYEEFGAYPKVTLANDINKDLKRRDFSINSLAIKIDDFLQSIKDKKIDSEIVKKKIIDNFSGLSDLKHRKIRVLHNKSFLEDPTRIYRAFRYKERIGGEIEKETFLLLKEAIREGVLDMISDGRKERELNKIKKEEGKENILRELKELNVID